MSARLSLGKTQKGQREIGAPGHSRRRGRARGAARVGVLGSRSSWSRLSWSRSKSGQVLGVRAGGARTAGRGRPNSPGTNPPTRSRTTDGARAVPDGSPAKSTAPAPSSNSAFARFRARKKCSATMTNNQPKGASRSVGTRSRPLVGTTARRRAFVVERSREICMAQRTSRVPASKELSVSQRSSRPASHLRSVRTAGGWRSPGGRLMPRLLMVITTSAHLTTNTKRRKAKRRRAIRNQTLRPAQPRVAQSRTR